MVSGVESGAKGGGAGGTFLEAGGRGENAWWRYALGVVFVVFVWFVVGGWASVALGSLLGVSAGQVAAASSSAGPIAA
jgi:hypothetical protein